MAVGCSQVAPLVAQREVRVERRRVVGVEQVVEIDADVGPAVTRTG